MAVSKLLNLLALSSLAILACSFGPAPVSAISVQQSHHFARNAAHGHQVIAKKKRANSSKRCKPRSSSLAASASSTPKVSTTATVVAQTTNAAATTKAAAAAAATTSTKAAVVTTTNSGAKVGLAWPNGDDASIKNFKTSKVSAVYTWSPWKPALSDSLGLEFIPMLWGEKQVSDFTNLVVAGYAKTVLGFNEPNQSGQSDMSPGQAAALWKQYIQPLKSKGYALISPAVTSAPSGITWMKDFFAACDGCTFDGCALHWYGTDAQEFISYLQSFHDAFGLPIWPTEFACQNFSGGAQCTQDQVNSFMATVTGFMDSTSWVAKYFAFGVMHDMVGVNTDNQLMASNGFPTALGYQYIN